MESKNNYVPVSTAGGAQAGGPATEAGPINVPEDVWYIIEKGIMVNPTFTITIKARNCIVLSSRDVEVEIDRFGLSIKIGDEELIIDPRYNTAELWRRGKLVAISNKVRYRWILSGLGEKVYETKEFAAMVRNAVKELIEESINITAFS
jgi:hypothetical protein